MIHDVPASAGSDQARQTSGAFIAWPGWSHLSYAIALGAANGIWFILVFMLGDGVTAGRSLRVNVHFDWELALPFVVEMTAFYMSMYLLFIMAPFVLRRRCEVRALVATLALVIGAAGVVFLLVPAVLAFPPVRADQLGGWASIFQLADDLNLTYNLIPSLHVALTVTCIAAMSARASAGMRMVLWCWATGVALSTLLLHQHHVVDVLSGWLLAILAFEFLYKRLLVGEKAISGR